MTVLSYDWWHMLCGILDIANKTETGNEVKVLFKCCSKFSKSSQQ